MNMALPDIHYSAGFKFYKYEINFARQCTNEMQLSCPKDGFECAYESYANNPMYNHKMYFDACVTACAAVIKKSEPSDEYIVFPEQIYYGISFKMPTSKRNKMYVDMQKFLDTCCLNGKQMPLIRFEKIFVRCRNGVYKKAYKFTKFLTPSIHIDDDGTPIIHAFINPVDPQDLELD